MSDGVKPKDLEQQLKAARKSLAKAEKSGRTSLAESLREKLRKLESHGHGDTSQAPVADNSKVANKSSATKKRKLAKDFERDGKDESDTGGDEQEKAIDILLRAHAKAKEREAQEESESEAEGDWWKDPELLNAIDGDKEARVALSQFAEALSDEEDDNQDGEDRVGEALTQFAEALSDDSDEGSDTPAGNNKPKLKADLSGFFALGGNATPASHSSPKKKKIRRNKRKDRTLAQKGSPSLKAIKRPKSMRTLTSDKCKATKLDIGDVTVQGKRRKKKKVLKTTVVEQASR